MEGRLPDPEACKPTSPPIPPPYPLLRPVTPAQSALDLVSKHHSQTGGSDNARPTVISLLPSHVVMAGSEAKSYTAPPERRSPLPRVMTRTLARPRVQLFLEFATAILSRPLPPVPTGREVLFHSPLWPGIRYRYSLTIKTEKLSFSRSLLFRAFHGRADWSYRDVIITHFLRCSFNRKR